MTVIVNDVAWDRYKDAVEKENGLAQGQVVWGKGPAKFPALVCTFFPNPGKAVSAYVYVDDAIALINATGTLAVTPTAKVEAEAHHSQKDFNHHVSAMLLSIVQTMVQKGLVIEDMFETRLASNRAVVDRWAKDEERAMIRKAVEGAGLVLGELPEA